MVPICNDMFAFGGMRPAVLLCHIIDICGILYSSQALSQFGILYVVTKEIIGLGERRSYPFTY
jgi:hypothetical protein